MKAIAKDELYEHLTGFLKSKGIELTEGSYSQTIQKSCSILADAINLGQKGVEKAKTEIDQKLEKVRQIIHDKTAPKPDSAPDSTVKPGSASQEPPSPPTSSEAKQKTRKTKAPSRKSKRGRKQP